MMAVIWTLAWAAVWTSFHIDHAGAGGGRPSGKVGVEEVRHFDHVITSYMRERHIPGASIVISKDGTFLLRKGYGRASDQQLVSPWSLFRIGSVSKPVTAAAALRLHELGRLDLDGRVFAPGGLLAEYYPARDADPRLQRVTVRHLLWHTAGWDQRLAGDPLFNTDLLRNASHGAGLRVIIDYVMSQPLQFTPGTRFAYSNFGYGLLGRAVAVASGGGYEEYVRGMLHQLGIQRMRLGASTRDQADDSEAEYYSEYPGSTVPSVLGGAEHVPRPYGGFSLELLEGSGGWLATPSDLVRFFDSLNRTCTRCRSLLKPQTFQMMLEPARKAALATMWYGMGVVVEDFGRSYWHSGLLDGSTAFLSHDDTGYTWAVLMNRKLQKNDLADLMRYAIRKFLPRQTFVKQLQQRSLFASSRTENDVLQKKGPSLAPGGVLDSYADAITKNGRNVVMIMVPEFKLKTTIDEMSRKFYKLNWINAVSNFGVTSFNLIWSKNSDLVKWKAYISLSPSRYTRRFKSKIARGYRLAHIHTYVSQRRLRYAAIFVRDSWPPWVTYHGYSPQRHKEQFYRYLESGYRLVIQSVVEFKGKVYVAALYEKIFIGDFRVRMGLSLPQFTEELQKQMKHGRILSYILAYQHKGVGKFSAIWVPQMTSAWAVSHDMTKYTLLHKLQVYADVNVPLLCVAGYVERELVKFAAVWT